MESGPDKRVEFSSENEPMPESPENTPQVEWLDDTERSKRFQEVQNEIRQHIGNRSPEELVEIWSGESTEQVILSADIEKIESQTGFKFNQWFGDAANTWGATNDETLEQIDKILREQRDSIPDYGDLTFDGWVPSTEAHSAVALAEAPGIIDEALNSLAELRNCTDQEQRDAAAIAFNFVAEKITDLISTKSELIPVPENSEGRQIELEVAPDIEFNNLEKIHGPEALSKFVNLLPTEFQPAIQKVSVKESLMSDYANYDNAIWFSDVAGNYVEERQNIQMNAEYINSNPDAPGCLIHEAAHGLDLTPGMTDLQTRAEFITAVSEEENQTSIYASETYARQGMHRGLEEDWAESIKLFFTRPDHLAGFAPKRMKVIEGYLQRQFPNLDIADVRGRVAELAGQETIG